MSTVSSMMKRRIETIFSSIQRVSFIRIDTGAFVETASMARLMVLHAT